MFEKYKATKEDIDTLAEAINHVSDNRLSYIFREKERIQNTIPVSYDSEKIYLFCDGIELDLKRYSESANVTVYSIDHNVEIDDSMQKGWRSTMFKVPELRELIPVDLRKEFKMPSGGLLTPFTQLQKDTPYSTKEGYMATIIHEYGHVYYDSYKLHWQSDKERNLSLFDQATKYLEGENVDSPIPVNLPVHKHLSEVFAFCTDYSATKELWPKQVERLNDYYLSLLNEYREKEATKDFSSENPVLDENPHVFSIVAGIKLLIKSEDNWGKILLNQQKL